MTLIQILLLAIACLALLLSAQLIRAVAAQRRATAVEVEPSFRQVGTFGSLRYFNPEVMPLPSTGSAGKGVFVLLALFAFAAMGIMTKFTWDESHPDIRSAYGRAYEHCVQKEGISRWNVKEVQRCIYRLPSR